MIRFGVFASMGGVAVLALTALTACRKPKDAVKSDLGEAGYQVTAADWFRASRGNDESALKKFVSSGFDLQTRDASGDSALHAAAAAGARDSADFLLDRGLPVDLRGGKGRTPLMSAVVAGQTAMVRWLLKQGAAPRLVDEEGFEALMLAVRENKSGPAAELAPLGRERLDSAILLAAMEGHAQIIDVLTNYGASVYTRMNDGRTPLMLAAQNGKAEAVAMLLDIGAGRLAVDAEGRTAADLATAAGHTEIASIINRNPKPAELALETAGEISQAMDEFVDSAMAKIRPTEAGIAVDANDATGPGTTTVVAARAPSRPISGETLSAAVKTADADAGRKSPPTAAGTATKRFDMPPLVMRHYREREMPVRVLTVSGDTASLKVQGESTRELKLRVGETIPGSPLRVVRVEHRTETSKLNQGRPTDVSVVEVRDTRSGTTRRWIAGVPSGAHDPVALVEDATTGKRYTAVPGQRFKSAGGDEFIVSDVRPDQLVIEEAATGAVQTIPLRGPRG
jgi:ankyrin repeat protein